MFSLLFCPFFFISQPPSVQPRLFFSPTGLRFLYGIMHGHGLDTTVIFLHATSSHPHGVPDAMDNVDRSATFNHFHALLPARGQYHAYDAR